MKLSFYGADQCVTGSCHCLEVNGKKILVDCGLQQGRDEIDNAALPFHPGSIDVVLVTHAHIDHSGRIPMLIKNGFQGRIITTRLTADLLDIMLACTNGTLDQLDIQWSGGAACCIVMASGGYPVQYVSGKEISGLDADGQLSGATVYHAGTRREGGKYFTAGGRVLGVTATGDTLDSALDGAYAAVSKIHFDGAHYRNDIGRKAGGHHGH